MNMLDWVKEYSAKQAAKQKEIDDNPDAQTLYTFEINIDTLEISSDEIKVLDYNDGVTGFAEHEESEQSSRVYAESLISSDKARMIVIDYLRKFYKAYFQVLTGKN